MAVVTNGDAPFGIVVGDVERVVAAPTAALLILNAHDWTLPRNERLISCYSVLNPICQKSGKQRGGVSVTQIRLRGTRR